MRAGKVGLDFEMLSKYRYREIVINEILHAIQQA